MDQTTDVDRLFSWLKNQDLKYREFASTREISDAVGSWPALHKAAADAGHPTHTDAPERDVLAKERLARDRMTMPPAAVEAMRAPPPVTDPPAMASGRLLSALGRRVQAARAGQEPLLPVSQRPIVDRVPQGPLRTTDTSVDAVSDDGVMRDMAAHERARESAERLRDRLDAAMAVNPRPTAGSDTEPADDNSYEPPPVDTRRGLPVANTRGGTLFGGAYRSRQPDTYADPPDSRGGGRGHSLQAVFSRLSGTRGGALRDPRERGRGSLGSVFNRLR